MRFVFAAVLAAVLPVTLAAGLAPAPQWPLYVRPEVPRAADGSPDLNAPAPRLPNGRPDFTGTWESRVGPSGRLGGPFLPSLTPDAPPVATFVDAGRNVKGGLPYTPWADQLRKQRMARFSQDNPDAQCLPMGFLQTHTHSQPRRIVHTKDDLIVMYEANQGLRQIFTDGRSLPEGPNPQWEGYSVGRWDGDTLVVESLGFRDEGWLDVNGSPFTNALRLTERYRRVNYGRIEIDVTINDPKAYTQPFTLRVNWRLEPAQQLIEFICQENNVSKQHYVAPPLK
jgi:hypothetical protein